MPSYPATMSGSSDAAQATGKACTRAALMEPSVCPSPHREIAAAIHGTAEQQDRMSRRTRAEQWAALSKEIGRAHV